MFGVQCSVYVDDEFMCKLLPMYKWVILLCLEESEAAESATSIFLMVMYAYKCVYVWKLFYFMQIGANS